MIGTKLSDRYEITEELGRGGMGVVYRARDPMLSRDVAVKLIPPTLLTADTEERFRREAQLVAQMDHAGIVSIFDLGSHEGSLFFVMPVVQGTTLRILLRQGPPPLGDIIDTAIQVAEALEYSHARGIIHRDIKPENIMLSRDKAGAVMPSTERSRRSSPARRSSCRCSTSSPTASRAPRSKDSPCLSGARPSPTRTCACAADLK